jgi:uncharacterized membrane protein
VPFNSQVQYGISNFDNVIQSVLAVMQVITFDSWTTVMFNLMDSSNYWLSGIYCCLIVILCSFFLLKLILAVILQSFQALHKKDEEKEMEEEQIKSIENKIRLKREEAEKEKHNYSELSQRFVAALLKKSQ